MFLRKRTWLVVAILVGVLSLLAVILRPGIDRRIHHCFTEDVFPGRRPRGCYDIFRGRPRGLEDALCRALKDRTFDRWGNRPIAYWATTVLGEIGTEKSLYSLRGAMKSKADPRVQRAAERAFLSVLLGTMRSYQDRRANVSSPAALRDRFGKAVSELARSRDLQIRCLAIRCLGHMAYLRDLPFVVSMLDERPRCMSQAALEAVVAYSHAPGLSNNDLIRNPLLRILEGTDPEERYVVLGSARAASGRRREGVHIPSEALLRFLHDEDPRTVVESLGLLSHRKERAAVEPALRLLDHPNEQVRRSARCFLEMTQFVTADEISLMMSAGSWRARYGAFRVAMKAFYWRLPRDEEAEFRKIIRASVDCPDVRISTLARSCEGDKEAVELRKKMEAGVKAMVTCGDERIIPFVAGALQDGLSRYETDVALRFLAEKRPGLAERYVLENFGRAGISRQVLELLGPRAVKILEDILRSGNPRVKLRAQ